MTSENDLIREGIEAMRLTREYVGEKMLPNIKGWSHYDWTEKAKAFTEAQPPSGDSAALVNLMKWAAEFAIDRCEDSSTWHNGGQAEFWAEFTPWSNEKIAALDLTQPAEPRVVDHTTCWEGCPYKTAAERVTGDDALLKLAEKWRKREDLLMKEAVETKEADENADTSVTITMASAHGSLARELEAALATATMTRGDSEPAEAEEGRG